MTISVITCYALAWKSFAKWWIPLCLISGALVAVEIVPRVVVRGDVDELMATARSSVDAIARNDLGQLADIAQRMEEQTVSLIPRIALLGLYIFPLAALLTVILLLYANRAAKGRRDAGLPFTALTYIAAVHVVLAIGKGLAFSLFFFPGVYIYIKLLFVSLIMLEGRTKAGIAIKMSWQMTRGHFWDLFLLIFVNTVIQSLMIPTVIGLIPATGFANTARATAFRMIWEEGDYALPAE